MLKKNPSSVEVLEVRIAPATLSWVGDVDANWATKNFAGNTNWSGDVLPQDGDALVFPAGASNRTNANDLSGLDLLSITFGGTDYHVFGNAITLSEGISDGSSGGANVLHIDVALTASQAVSVSMTETRLSMYGRFSGAFDLAKNGAGILLLQDGRDSGVTGTTTVNEGTLELRHLWPANSIVGPLIIGDGTGTDTVRVTGPHNIADDVPVTLRSSGVFDLSHLGEVIGALTLESGTSSGAQVMMGDGHLTLNGDVTMNVTGTGAAGVGISGILNLGAATRTFAIADGVADQDLTISAKIIGEGGLTKTGGGTLQLSGVSANSYSGATTVADGVLGLAKTDGPGSLTFLGGLAVGDDIGVSGSARLILQVEDNIPGFIAVVVRSDGVFDLNDTNETIAGLTLTNGTAAAAQVITGAGTLTVNGDVSLLSIGTGATTASIAGKLDLGGMARTFDIADGGAANDLDVSAVISNGSLTKEGAGRLRLNGVNTYTGATLVNAGTLLVDAVQAGASPVTVANGATLAGDGAVGAVLVQAGGTVTPGVPPNFVDVLPAGNVTLAIGANFAVKIDGTAAGATHDLLAATGMVDLTGATLRVALGFAPANNDTFVILTNDDVDAIIGTFAALPEGGQFKVNGQRFAISYTGGDGNDVALTAVPFTPPVVTLANGGRKATFIEGDGDVVIVKITAGALTERDFTFVDFADGTLGALALNRAEFNGANLKITVKPGLGGGNGFVNLGHLDAIGVDLGAVSIAGDLGRVTAGDGDPADRALKSLTARSLGVLGTDAQAPGGNLNSLLDGAVGMLTFNSDWRGATLTASGNIAAVSIGGSMLGGVIGSDQAFGTLTVLGNVVGIAGSPVIVAAAGRATEPTAGADVAIKKLKVGGGVEFLRVLAGYNSGLAGVNADASVGKISVGGDWRASSVLAGSTAGADNLDGTADDTKLASFGSTDTVSQIASVVIKGQVFGTATENDSFGIVSEQILAAKIGGVNLKLAQGPGSATDAFSLSPFPSATGIGSDFFLREIVL